MRQIDEWLFLYLLEPLTWSIKNLSRHRVDPFMNLIQVTLTTHSGTKLNRVSAEKNKDCEWRTRRSKGARKRVAGSDGGSEEGRIREHRNQRGGIAAAIFAFSAALPCQSISLFQNKLQSTSQVGWSNPSIQDILLLWQRREKGV